MLRLTGCYVRLWSRTALTLPVNWVSDSDGDSQASRAQHRRLSIKLSDSLRALAVPQIGQLKNSKYFRSVSLKAVWESRRQPLMSSLATVGQKTLLLQTATSEDGLVATAPKRFYLGRTISLHGFSSRPPPTRCAHQFGWQLIGMISLASWLARLRSRSILRPMAHVRSFTARHSGVGVIKRRPLRGAQWRKGLIEGALSTSHRFDQGRVGGALRLFLCGKTRTHLALLTSFAR